MVPFVCVILEKKLHYVLHICRKVFDFHVLWISAHVLSLIAMCFNTWSVIYFGMHSGACYFLCIIYKYRHHVSFNGGETTNCKLTLLALPFKCSKLIVTKKKITFYERPYPVISPKVPNSSPANWLDQNLFDEYIV